MKRQPVPSKFETSFCATHDEDVARRRATKIGGLLFRCTLQLKSVFYTFYVAAKSRTQARELMTKHYKSAFQRNSLRALELYTSEDHLGPENRMVPIKIHNAIKDIYKRIHDWEERITVGVNAALDTIRIRTGDLESKYDDLKRGLEATQQAGAATRSLVNGVEASMLGQGRDIAKAFQRLDGLTADTLKCISAINDMKQTTGSRPAMTGSIGEILLCNVSRCVFRVDRELRRDGGIAGFVLDENGRETETRIETHINVCTIPQQ